MTTPREPRPGECWALTFLGASADGHARVTGGPSAGLVEYVLTPGGRFVAEPVRTFMEDFSPCTEHPSLPEGGSAP